ncbi:hypothetical protein [Salinarimonas sp.]|uniref:hypothetical protein n=1 Tax=Salinarimonas sp. TaxID=2766526 RepID=UPI0032D93326
MASRATASGAVAAAGAAPQATGDPTAASRNAVLVGHGLVGPTMSWWLQNLAPDGGSVQGQEIDGSLSHAWSHSADAEGVDSRALMAQGKTDVLIVTEAIPLQDQITYNDTYGHARLFYDAAIAGKPSARVFLYETWHDIAWAGGEAAWRERLDSDLIVWEAIVDHVNMNRGASGGEQMRLVPAGQAMARLHDEIAAGSVPGATTIRDFLLDDIHVNDAGMYYLSMLTYAAIWQRSPVGLPLTVTNEWDTPFTLDATLAARLQQLAWETITTYPRSGVHIVRPGQLALGLEGVHDYSQEQPFIDVIKCGRTWLGHISGQYGGWGHDDLAAGGYLDADGWITSMPPELSHVELVFLTEIAAGAAPVMAGRYRLLYEGAGTITVTGGSNLDTSTPGQIDFDYTPTGTNLCSVRIDAITRGDHLRNIRCYNLANEIEYNAGRIFNPHWLNRIRGVPMVRFMDWQHTNWSPTSAWAERNTLTSYTWSRAAGNGVPVEVMVALCNEMLCDGWFCMPHQATDDFVTRFATYVRDNLDPRLEAHVEFSNEVWNFAFSQAAYAQARADARGWGEGAWMQWAGERTAQTMNIWTTVFSGQTSRIVRVAGAQLNWKGLETEFLDAPLSVAEGNAAPHLSFDVYAVTGYFSGQLGEDGKAPIVKSWIDASLAAARNDATARGLTGGAYDDDVAAHEYDQVSVQCLQELTDGSVTGLGVDTATIEQNIRDYWPYHRARADAYGLRLVMYEGGTHVVGVGGDPPWIEDAQLTRFFQHFNFSPEMATAYERAIEGWEAVGDGGNGVFMQFVAIYKPTKWGSWGALRHLRDANPRWTMLRRHNAGGPL